MHQPKALLCPPGGETPGDLAGAAGDRRWQCWESRSLHTNTSSRMGTGPPGSPGPPPPAPASWGRRNPPPSPCTRRTSTQPCPCSRPPPPNSARSWVHPKPRRLLLLGAAPYPQGPDPAHTPPAPRCRESRSPPWMNPPRKGTQGPGRGCPCPALPWAITSRVGAGTAPGSLLLPTLWSVSRHRPTEGPRHRPGPGTMQRFGFSSPCSPFISSPRFMSPLSSPSKRCAC